MLCIANGVQKKVFSLDIEKVLLKHPEVEKCAVVPIDDETVNQAPIAFIVLSDLNADQSAAEAALSEYAEQNLEPVCRPRKYFFVPKYPLTKVGKVDYRALERMAAG